MEGSVNTMKPYYENEYGVLYEGDCLEIMPNLNTKVDLVLTDPPYGTTACKWDSVIPFEDMWKALETCTRKETPKVLFGSEPFSSLLRCSNLKEFKYDWKWDKTVGGNPLIAKYRPLGVFEDVMVFGKGSVNYYPIMEKAKKENIRPLGQSSKKSDLLSGIKSGKFRPKDNYNKELRYPKNHLVFSSREAECNPLNRSHPTQKPVALLAYLIRTYSNENDLVLDFTAGSSSTAIACMNTNRKFIMIEKEEKYCEISAKRMEEHLNKMKSEFEDI